MFLAIGGVSLYGCDKQSEAAASAETGAEKADGEPKLPVPAEPALLAGKQIFEANCEKCHVEGLGDAPVIFQKALWRARVSQPKATLYEHAIKGFWGDVGEMPARGDNQDLTDAEVRSAVDYIVFVQQRS